MRRSQVQILLPAPWNKGAMTKWLIILPQPYFNWDIPLKDYLTFISIDLVWIPNNLAALEGNEPPQSAPPPAPPTGRAPTPWAMMLRLFRNCTPFALRALPSVGGSPAMRNEKYPIWFVLNLYNFVRGKRENRTTELHSKELHPFLQHQYKCRLDPSPTGRLKPSVPTLTDIITII